MPDNQQIVSLSLFRFRSPLARAWAFGQMAFARPALGRVPGLGFWKLLGSGTGEGFTPVPNTAVYGIMGTWPSLDAATHALSTAPVFRRYRDRAEQSVTLFMKTTSVRGRWSGAEPFEAQDAPAPTGPIAALTRATLRPSIAMRFWKRVPSISHAIGTDPNVMFKIGLGEVPLFHQVTFSVWPDAASMAAFARADGPHAAAIRAVREENWFSEELYARFQIVHQTGSWSMAPNLLAPAHPMPSKVPAE